MHEKMYSRPFSNAGAPEAISSSSSSEPASDEEREEVGTGRILKVVVKKERMSRRSWTLASCRGWRQVEVLVSAIREMQV
jgi:hypothetical protein